MRAVSAQGPCLLPEIHVGASPRAGIQQDPSQSWHHASMFCSSNLASSRWFQDVSLNPLRFPALVYTPGRGPVNVAMVVYSVIEHI